MPNHSSPVKRKFVCRLKTSTWFTRGWTLQELLAPNLVLFWNVDWEQFGVKSVSMAYGETLTDIIASATGIPSEYLQRPGIAREACFAQKLSWPSQRRTTRGEDVVYCLLGLLYVNMPLLYGEGIEKGFLRLQKEFMEDSDDESIFLWDRPDTFDLRDDDNDTIEQFRLLAPDPCLFKHAATTSLRIREAENDYSPLPPYTLTTKDCNSRQELSKSWLYG